MSRRRSPTTESGTPSKRKTWRKRRRIRQGLFSRHISAADLEDALRELLTYRVIEVVRKPTSGRTATVVRAIPRPGSDDNYSDIVM